jgi:hypothetical protein
MCVNFILIGLPIFKVSALMSAIKIYAARYIWWNLIVKYIYEFRP